MTVNEIKQHYTMQDILMRYDIQSKGINRNISCPFHTDKQPSMKIFPSGFKCFSCNESGDIFKFVQLMEECDFKDAFLSLGGTYENVKEDFSAKLRLESAKRAQMNRIQSDLRQKRLRRDIGIQIAFYRAISNTYEPLSDVWCDAQYNLFMLMKAWEEKYIKETEVDIVGTISRYSKLKFIRDFIRRDIS